MSLEKFKTSLQTSPIIKKRGYSYIVHPILDGIPYIQPAMLKEILEEMKKFIEKFDQIDRIVTVEAMGIVLATALSLELNIPFTIIRKRQYTLPDEMAIEQVTGYSESTLYVNGLNERENVLIVDDLISTGGTLRAVVFALKKKEVNVRGIVVAVDKGDCLDTIGKTNDIKIFSLAKVAIVDGDIIVK
jgi:adenine phosphoribosyltransferase